MPFSLPPLPSFNVQTPDITQKMLEAAQLRNLTSEMALRKALAPGQVQGQQLQLQQQQQQNQMSQMELQSRQALMAALSDPDFSKTFTGTDQADATGLGFDPNALMQGLISRGVKDPNVVNGFIGPLIQRSQQMAEIRKTNAQAAEAQAAVMAKGNKNLADRIAAITDADRADQPGMLAQLKQDLLHKNQVFNGVSHDDLAHVFAADLQHLPAMATMLGLDAQIADYHKSQAENTKAQQGVINPQTGMSPEMAAQGQKDIAVLKATQPLKLQQELAGVKAKQLMEGMTVPGYAFNPQTGQTQLTDQSTYLQARGALQGFRKVTEKDVRDDTMLTNRLGDVHQKLSEYEAALKKPLSTTEKSDIAGLLGEGAKGGAAAKLGALGVGMVIPMDRLNQFMDSASLAELGPNARDQLIAYRNMREAMIGYKTVLSGSSRGSDKSMELLEDMVPNPAVTDRDYSQRSLNAFRGNLNVVGQGLPQLPGIKGPQDWEIQNRQQRFAPPRKLSKFEQNMGFIAPTQP